MTRERQFELGHCRRRTCFAVYAAFLKGADVFLREPINGVDINVLYNPTEVYVESVLYYGQLATLFTVPS